MLVTNDLYIGDYHDSSIVFDKRLGLFHDAAHYLLRGNHDDPDVAKHIGEVSLVTLRRRTDPSSLLG